MSRLALATGQYSNEVRMSQSIAVSRSWRSFPSGGRFLVGVSA